MFLLWLLASFWSLFFGLSWRFSFSNFLPCNWLLLRWLRRLLRLHSSLFTLRLFFSFSRYLTLLHESWDTFANFFKRLRLLLFSLNLLCTLNRRVRQFRLRVRHCFLTNFFDLSPRMLCCQQLSLSRYNGRMRTFQFLRFAFWR